MSLITSTITDNFSVNWLVENRDETICVFIVNCKKNTQQFNCVEFQLIAL